MQFFSQLGPSLFNYRQLFEPAILVHEAEALLTIAPASRSACVTVCEAVQVIDAPGASDSVAGQVTVTLLSLTVNGPSSVTLPVFVTT